MPIYPTGGPVMNRAKRGLFEGRHIDFGNHVSFSKIHERRRWLPNIQEKHLESKILNINPKIKVSTCALKTIKKRGGLDQYLVSSKHVSDSYVGRVMRANLLQVLSENPQIPFPTPRRRMPSPPKSWATVSSVTAI